MILQIYYAIKYWKFSNNFTEHTEHRIYKKIDFLTIIDRLYTNNLFKVCQVYNYIII